MIMELFICGIALPGIWYCVCACKRSFMFTPMHVLLLEHDNILVHVPGPLQGHLKVDILDSAFATLHFGFIGFDLHLFKAELCMKGHIEYGLNILKVSFIFTVLFHCNVLVYSCVSLQCIGVFLCFTAMYWCILVFHCNVLVYASCFSLAVAIFNVSHFLYCWIMITNLE